MGDIFGQLGGLTQDPIQQMIEQITAPVNRAGLDVTAAQQVLDALTSQPIEQAQPQRIGTAQGVLALLGDALTSVGAAKNPRIRPTQALATLRQRAEQEANRRQQLGLIQRQEQIGGARQRLASAERRQDRVESREFQVEQAEIAREFNLDLEKDRRDFQREMNALDFDQRVELLDRNIAARTTQPDPVVIDQREALRATMVDAQAKLRELEGRPPSAARNKAVQAIRQELSDALIFADPRASTELSAQFGFIRDQINALTVDEASLPGGRSVPSNPIEAVIAAPGLAQNEIQGVQSGFGNVVEGTLRRGGSEGIADTFAEALKILGLR